MRILLASTASYVPPRGGSTRSNLKWLEALSANGHVCRVVASVAAGTGVELKEQGYASPQVNGHVEVGHHGAIEVHSARHPSQRAALLREQIHEFRPDWVLVSSEDLAQVLLREAVSCAPGRVVYLAHTPQFYPFGPESWNPNREGTEAVRRCAAVVAISRTMRDYIEKHAGCATTVIHPPMYGEGPYSQYENFGVGYFTIINPCTVKGISIFRDLVSRFPSLPFAALPGWGTTAADRASLNVTWLPHARNIDEIFRQTRVLLVPSLWLEGFGLVVIEAMLRGIPVVASAWGGLLESKLGTRFSEPVSPVQRYEPVFDERSMPRAIIPEQDLGPWVAAVNTLAVDEGVYRAESAASREAAHAFVSSVHPGALEQMLMRLKPSGAKTSASREPVLANLSPEKRALLLNRLRRKN